jgi:chromosome segregation ATPase
MVYQIRKPQNRIQVWKNVEAEKIWELEDTVEILNSQIEILKLELCHHSQDLSDLEQELRSTNDELCAAYDLVNTMSKLITINEAKELAKNLLTTGKPIKEVLSEFISTIYSLVITE